MGTIKTKGSKRKTKLFSVSFRIEDLIELEEYLRETKRVMGLELSRNELIRRSVLAHVRFEKDDSDLTYSEIFKNID